MKIRKTGNWTSAGRAAASVGPIMKKARSETLQEFADYGAKTAKEHIRKQDLGWPRLAPRTIAGRAKRGNTSTKILKDTGKYYESIEGWTDGVNTAYSGVKKGERHENGVELSELARVHEYGHTQLNIPERPLWFPTAWETMAWIKKNHNPAHYTVKKLSKV